MSRLLLADALGSRDGRPRRAFELACCGGLSQPEIAERRDAPLGTVSSDVRRALRWRRTVAGDAADG